MRQRTKTKLVLLLKILIVLLVTGVLIKDINITKPLLIVFLIMLLKHSNQIKLLQVKGDFQSVDMAYRISQMNKKKGKK